MMEDMNKLHFWPFPNSNDGEQLENHHLKKSIKRDIENTLGGAQAPYSELTSCLNCTAG